MDNICILLASVDWIGEVTKFGLAFWVFFSDMAPFLLFGFLAAGILSVLLSAEQVERHLGGHGFWPILKAALFGLPLPLCSCSVLPVAAALRRHGAGRGATTAFLISTPQTGVDNILVTLSLLGPVWAIFTPVATFVSGLLGGVAVDLLEPHGEADTEVVEKCTDSCCNGNGEKRPVHKRLASIFTYGFIELPRDLAKPLLIGVVIAGLIGVFVPHSFLEKVGTGVGGIFLLMLLGIPMYVCATASIPVAAALVASGASPGAALAFLITGPATNAAGIATIWKLLGRRTALIYLGAVALSALGAGLLLDLMVKELSLPPLKPTGEMLPEPVRIASAVVLLAILLYALLRKKACHDACCAHEHAHDKHDHHGHTHASV